jgi:hypothetical protein
MRLDETRGELAMAAVTERRLNRAENASEEIVSLEARQEQLLMLVAELLRTNEDLRQKVDRLEARGARAAAD